MNRLLPSILTLSVLAAAPAGAQTLSLFETTQRQEPGPQVSAPVGGPGQLEPGSGFSLRSVARFGDTYWGLVTDAAGNSMEVHWQPGAPTSLGELAQYRGYQVLELTAQTLRLQFPPGQPCRSSGQQGLVCVDDTTALLSLVALAPLQHNGSQPLPAQQPDAVTGPEQMLDDEEFINPFATMAAEAAPMPDADMAARVARARARAERLQQLPVDRIADDQIPPGMRRVRTPFGDRLVPVTE